MTLHGLKKSERLNHDIEISRLFAKGKRSFAFPLLMFYLPTEEVGEVAILCSVAKKRFKHAVDRNRVKRLIRESFRQNRKLLDPVLQEGNRGLHLAFVMSHTQLPASEQMNRAMRQLLTEVVRDLAPTEEQPKGGECCPE